ncbi:hypothetical protein [Polaribacter glomeratus]|uniref:Uncharacterized protein n=1 Tax=Polaribacter glomeratus TaxID=102 RepID=A0A2S7WH18_9FLAO|nr:hypothetical protein [Polaribacter glomeratus]PQJ76899.1 hypothetical protein BTO16_13610 [Polaribacter glomeratus]TXD67256.1 hypothetical protein ESX12_01305 [Polaribacter glomeratus]
MKKNIVLKLNDEVLLFTKNIKWDISENKKYNYLIVASKPFFIIDKLKTYLVEYEPTDFAKKQLKILLENCNTFLNLNKDYNAIKTDKTSSIVHYIDEANDKEFKGNVNNKKLVWFTGKTLLELNEDEFVRTYRNKNMFIYSHNYFTLSINEVKKLASLILEFINIEPQQKEIDKPKGAIQNLFNFIDFLHTNIDNFNKYNDIKNELNLLNSERDNLEPENSFNDKLRFDEIQKEVEQKFNIIHKNIIQLIEDKATENRIFEFNRTQILELKQNSNSKDLEILLNLRDKYFAFLEKTNSEYFPKFLFSNLNRLLKELFDFFDKSYKNEFKMFESSTIVRHFRNKDFTKIEDIEPQQKEIKIPDEVKKGLHTNIFNDNAFDIWQSMFDEFEIKESSYSTNLDFMFNVMQNQENKFLIHKAISKIRMVEWIDEVYQITFTKIRYTNHKANSNKNRLIIFNQITSK